jgi:hypothetical protein
MRPYIHINPKNGEYMNRKYSLSKKNGAEKNRLTSRYSSNLFFFFFNKRHKNPSGKKRISKLVYLKQSITNAAMFEKKPKWYTNEEKLFVKKNSQNLNSNPNFARIFILNRGKINNITKKIL